jgi:hypothetical protein
LPNSMDCMVLTGGRKNTEKNWSQIPGARRTTGPVASFLSMRSFQVPFRNNSHELKKIR